MRQAVSLPSSFLSQSTRLGPGEGAGAGLNESICLRAAITWPGGSTESRGMVCGAEMVLASSGDSRVIEPARRAQRELKEVSEGGG